MTYGTFNSVYTIRKTSLVKNQVLFFLVFKVKTIVLLSVRFVLLTDSYKLQLSNESLGSLRTYLSDLSRNVSAEEFTEVDALDASRDNQGKYNEFLLIFRLLFYILILKFKINDMLNNTTHKNNR